MQYHSFVCTVHVLFYAVNEVLSPDVPKILSYGQREGKTIKDSFCGKQIRCHYYQEMFEQSLFLNNIEATDSRFSLSLMQYYFQLNIWNKAPTSTLPFIFEIKYGCKNFS